MLFHRSLPCIKLLTGTSDEMVYKYPQWDFGSISQCAMDLMQAQKSFISIMEAQRQIYFITSYFIFEAAVTLSIAICRDASSPDSVKWRKERDGAIDILQSLLDMDNSEMTQQAIITLRILQDRRPPPTEAAEDTSPEASGADEPLSTTPEDFAWTLPDSQDPVMSSMFPMNTSYFQNPAVASADCTSNGTKSTNPFNLSGFDFLFNSVVP